jgi:hypothetical protein
MIGALENRTHGRGFGAGGEDSLAAGFGGNEGRLEAREEAESEI